MSRPASFAIIYAAIMCLCLLSCARRVTQKSTSNVDVSDTVHRLEAHFDSVHAEKRDSTAVVVLDSIIIYDSVHVTEHADGTRDTYRFRDRYRSAKRDATKVSSQSSVEHASKAVSDTIKSKTAIVEKSEKTTTKRMTALSYIMLTAIVSSLICILVLIHFCKVKA